MRARQQGKTTRGGSRTRKSVPWAILYNSADLAVIGPAANVIQIGGGGISTADRNAMRTMWTGGVSTWATAPVAPSANREGDADTRVLACTTGSLRGTATSFVELIEKYTRSGRLPNIYLLALCRDMKRPSGGRPTWP